MYEYQGTVYVSGHWVAANNASVSVFDHGFLYGDGVFDSLFARYGYIFKLGAHVVRFQKSMRFIGLELDLQADDLVSVVLETVRRNNLSDAYIKMIATRGITRQPLLDPRSSVPTLVVFAQPYLSVSDPEKARRGLRAKLCSIRRVGIGALDPRVKSLNYLNLVLAKMEAINAECDEALLLDDDGFVCEGPGYNTFVVHDGTVITPDRGVLEGITRETVRELCGELGIVFEERKLAPYDYYVADESFISSTAGGLMPITSVDGRPVGTGKPGQTFAMLAKAYDEMLRSGKHGTSISPM